MAKHIIITTPEQDAVIKENKLLMTMAWQYDGPESTVFFLDPWKNSTFIRLTQVDPDGTTKVQYRYFNPASDWTDEYAGIYSTE
jgi:hypothetical protein